MERGELFQTVRELSHMQEVLQTRALVELRGGEKPNPRERVEKIIANRASLSNVDGFGGNSNYLIQERGRIKQSWKSGFSVAELNIYPPDPYDDLISIAIFPFGIADTTADHKPVFYDPEKSNMRSIVIRRLEKDPASNSGHTFLKPVEPLFNIDEDGTVLVRSIDQPTPTELQLLHDILDAFEGN